MLRGETVTVIHMEERGCDALGSPVVVERREAVSDVLVCPGATADDVSSTRPAGAEVSYTLAFPRTYDRSLLGAEVEIRGERFAVVGDPRACRRNCPTRWWLRAEVTRSHG